ncbi:MAG: type and secretion system protein [Gemmatimonadetes bacterium]|nr:type and secretion system protein [Gemmatimonadota bacterium]
MKPVMAVIAATALVLGLGARPADARMAEGGEGKVTSLSVIPALGKAEIVVGVAGGIEVRDFTLRGPDRIVLDLSGVSLGLPANGYDHVARGGITDVRYAQNKPGTVRVVVMLTGPHSYQISKSDGEVRVTVNIPAGAQFAAWQIGRGLAVARKAEVEQAGKPAGEPLSSGPERAVDRAAAKAPRTASAPKEERETADMAMRTSVQQAPQSIMQLAQAQQQRSQQPRISVVYQGSDIRDVLAAFAAFSGRTIIPSTGVGSLKVDAEIKDQPWDVALRAILSAQGLAATEDADGIIIVDTHDRIAASAATEQLATRIVRLNYSRATPVGEQIRQRLLQCIPSERLSGGTPGGAAPAPAGQPPTAAAPAAQPTTATGAQGNGSESSVCRGRGSVSADEVTNSISITAPGSAVDDLVAFANSLDLRQPQVNIKAKIVLVNRTDLDALGIKYDLGSPRQFFSQVIQRVDSAGNVGSANDAPTVALGGNTVSAIANASGDVPGAALRLIYSTALGNFDFSTFLDALQQVSLLDVQSEPSVTTLNNRTATLVSGSQVPFVPLVSSGGTGTSLTGPVTVERVQTGVTLLVTPSVTNNRQIMMHVEVTNSDVNFTNNGTLIDNNNTKNDLLVADGQTVVIGGLTQTSVRVTKSGIPMLVDLPLIGRLFGYTTRQEQRRDLLVLITPHIIDDGQQPAPLVRP